MGGQEQVAIRRKAHSAGHGVNHAQRSSVDAVISRDYQDYNVGCRGVMKCNRC